ncbi:MAG: DEAD/DEAH box helicase [Candidatus Methanoplasma sp.]|jgi:ATP-dependent Lhr-like helicase|nr:DEAD/DEAH box helicase [Candidatus Methanoplasma sp.]
MSFDILSPELVSALKERGITKPTEPQEDVIPKILSGKNVLLVAPTGIGKTEAAMLPIFDSIFRTKGKAGIRCLYITPLRALNRDMLKRMEDYGETLGISVGVRHGDTSQAERNKQSQKAPEILITTPETLQVLFTGKRLREHLKNIEWVVIDEIHELSSTERGAQLGVALERLIEASGEYQRIGLSATVGDVDDVKEFLSGAGREVVLCKHDTHREFSIVVECPAPDENDAILRDRLQSDPDILAVMKRARELIEGGRSTLLFVNTRETAEWLAARYHLWDENFSIEVHHGSLSKENRMDIEDKFKNGELKAVIATSSLELGIDIGSADLVIQYNSPREVSRMIQRAGRAGHRIGETIKSVILATAPDEVAEALVVARRSDAKELEYFRGRSNPFTVLANQLVAMTMSGRMDRDTAYKIFRRSNPFRTLARSDMDDVLEQLKSIKMIFEDENGFRRSKKGMQYFYDNISMIPDERTYLIRDISTRGIIGTLDESFVASFAEPYAMFIAKGRTWRIIEMREDELLVEEARDVGSVPSWAGSDIPVPFEVAMEVGRMRRKMNLDRYPGDGNCYKKVEEYISEQKERWPVPSDNLVTLEIGDRLAILNCCFGSRVNETFGKIYSALLTARLGESIGVSTDAYRIILELPRNVDKKILEDTFRSIKPGTIEALARITILNSSYLKWRFVHVAKKFGIIEKGADHRFINFNRLFDLHKDTPAYNEAINMVLWEDLDIKNSELIVKMLSEGHIKMEISGVSPIGLEGIVRSKELMQPVRADHSILMALKKRLEEEVLHASCLNCTNQWRVRVSDAPQRFRCSRCGGNMIALLKGYERESIKNIKMKERNEQEKKDALRVSRNANLVNEYGKRAAIVLAGRGIGPDSASRILRSMHVDEDDFLRDIMNAEILYAKKKRFWD